MKLNTERKEKKTNVEIPTSSGGDGQVRAIKLPTSFTPFTIA